MNMKNPLLEYDHESFQTLLVSKGYPKYKAKTILQWIYKRSTFDFQEMSDLSKKDRATLSEDFDIITLTQEKMQESSDGTLKFLFTAQDG